MDPLLIGTLAQAGQGLKNNRNQLLMLGADIAYNEWQYGRKRKHNLQDWHMVNAYNSPAAQMQRLSDAGLNPNLVYGRGAGAVGEASPVKPSESGSPEFPKFNAVSPLFAGVDMQMKTAQTDNLKAQNTVLLEEALLKNATTMKMIADGKISNLEYDIKSELKDTTIEHRRELLRQLSQEIDIKLAREERDIVTHSANMAEAYTRIAKMRGETVNTHLRNEMLRLDLELYGRYKIRPSDPYYLRIFTEALEHAKKSVGKVDLLEWFGLKVPPYRGGGSSW